MKRPEASQAGAVHAPPDDERFSKKYPTIVEYMSTVVWEDGKARKPSKVQLQLEDGRFTVSLQDVDQERSLFVSGPTLDKALEALERVLGASGADWRRWRGPRGKK